MSSADANKFIQKVNIVKVDASGNVIEGSNIPLGDYTQSQIAYNGVDTAYINLFGDTLNTGGAWTFVGETDFTKKFYPFRISILMRHTLTAAQVDADVTCGIIGQKDGIWLDMGVDSGILQNLFAKIFKREDFKLDGLTGFGWQAVATKDIIDLIPLDHNWDIDIALLDELSRTTSAVRVDIIIYGFLI